MDGIKGATIAEKYRAKRKDNGEWFFGYPVDSDEGWFMIDDNAVAFTEMESEVSFMEVCSISRDTLSRCSGLDACGQDVYEGDILRLRFNGTDEWWTAVLRFGWHYGGGEYGWYLEPIRGTVLTKRIGVWLGEDRLPGVTAAVIGNVWDNPEMMGV